MKKFLATLITLFLPILAVAQTAQEEEDKGFLIELIEDNLSGVSRDVNITGFEGALSSQASLDRLTVADEEGIWLSLEDVVLDWNRGALLRGRIEVNELSAARIVVARAPISDGSGEEAPSPEAQPFSLPELPVSIRLDQLQIDRIELGESFLGEPVNVRLTGSASLAGGEGNANVSATRLDPTSGQFIIEGSYSNETRQLALNLDVTEDADGIAAKLLDIPGRPALALTVQGDGPIDTFAADIALATDGQNRIAGQFARTQDNGLQGFDLNIGGDITPLLEPAYHDFFGDDLRLIARGSQLEDGRFDFSNFDIAAQRVNLKGAALMGAEGWPERFSLTGSITDPSGEVVLLPLSGPQTFINDVALSVSYDQAVSEDWTADFEIKGFDRPGLYIDMLQLSGGGILRSGEGAQIGEVTADFTYAAEGLALDDPGTAQAFGDTVSGVISANRTEGEPLNIDQVTIRGPGLEADAQATIDGSGEALSITSVVDLSVTALGRFSTLAGRSLGGSADVSITSAIDPLNGLYDIDVAGTTRDLQVDVAQVDPLLAGDGTIAINFIRDADGTRLENLDIATDEATISANADITSIGSDARFDARVRDLRLVEPSLSGPVRLGGTVTQSTSGPVKFEIEGLGPDVALSAEGSATQTDPGYAVEVDLIADLADLSTFASLAQRPLDGQVTAELSGTLQTDGLLFDGTLAMQSTDLVTGVAELDPLLSGTGTIRTDLARTGATQYRASGLQMRLPELRLDADATADLEGEIDAEFDIALTDIGLILPELSGRVTASGVARRDESGTTQLDVAASAPGATADVDVSISPDTNGVSGDVSAFVADLSIYADLIGQPLSGSVSAAATGDLVFDFSAFDVTLDVATSDLATGITQADPLLSGPGQITAIARRSATGLTVPTLQINTQSVSMDATLQAVADGRGSGTFDARINDVGLIAPGLSGPATVKGEAEQSPDRSWQITGDVLGPGVTANADLAVAAETQELSGTLVAAINDLAAYRAIIGQPVSGGVTANIAGRMLPDLSRFATDVSLETQDIGIGNATVDVLLRGLGDLSLSAERSAEGLRIGNFDARTNNISLSGSFDTSNAGDSQGQFQVRLRDIGLFTDQLSGPVTAEGTASAGSNGTIGLDITGAGPGGIVIAAAGSVAGASNVNINIDGTVPLGLANAALAPRRINGTADLDLSVNGPATVESVSGRIAIADARLAAPTLNQALDNISGSVALSNGTARVNLSGDVLSGGALTITGPVGMTGALQSDVLVTLQNVVLRDPELYQSSVDGTINVTGPLAGGAQIIGRLNLGQTDVQVPSSGVGSLGDLPDVVHVGETSAVAQTRLRAGVSNDSRASGASRGAGGPTFPLDIVVNAPSRIFIRGRGLDAELGGRLSLGGTSANILPVGQFSLIRGRLDVLQQRFQLTEGIATLQGDFDPFIRLVAETEARTGTKIRIVVEGPAGAPDVRFESTPQLPQDEVLAQLIFGRDLSEISPLQAVQLAAAVGTLAGRGGGGLINGFRQGVGLDDFDVTTDEDGNAAVRAGAYLSENVYTDVTINGQGETEINLNLDITREVTAKGTVDQNGDTSLGLFFERDY